jgi:AbiV family abortive infection protein
MNRTDLQNLAEERLADAKGLLANGRFGGAYYLAGYVIECALKACIAKLTKSEDFYDKDLAKKIFVHDPARLAHEAGLSAVIEERKRNDAEFNKNWTLVNEWSEESRYERHSMQDAREILAAVSDPNHGVLQRIKQYW